jgi:DNA-binding NarL/FixJ family response regulator
MIKVALFEDNRHFRETLELLISSSPLLELTGAYADAKNAVAMLTISLADVVLMDIEMPGTNGIEATRLIKQHFPDILVLVQTAFAEDKYIYDAICAGASGYVLKTTSTDGYVEAILNAHAGGSPMTPGIARRVLELFRNQGLGTASQEDYDLTRQEKVVLQHLVVGKSYKMIAAELFISHETVKTHVGRIYTKLKVHNGTEAVYKAIRERII